MKILVIYDGSPDSKAGLKYGVQKARVSGGELIAFHLFPRTGFHEKNKNPRPDEPVMGSLRGHKKVKTFVNTRGDVISIAVAAVNQWDEILHFAEKLAVDLIVGHRHLRR